MFRLLETIQLKNGVLQNIDYHNARINRSLIEFFNVAAPIDLSRKISPPRECIEGTYRCRVIYSTEIESVEFIPYTPRKIDSLKIVHSDILYSHKFADRSGLNVLLESREGCDDILIVKNGLLTDTSFSNIALWHDGRWFTPKTPLLAGTKRQKLLDEGLLTSARISIDDISHYEKLSLINSMLDPGDTCIEISSIE